MPVAGRRRAANLLRGPGARTLGTTQHSWARDHGATARNPRNSSRTDHCPALGRSTDRHLLIDAANPGLRQVLLRRGAGARLVLRARFPARGPSKASSGECRYLVGAVVFAEVAPVWFEPSIAHRSDAKIPLASGVMLCARRG